MAPAAGLPFSPALSPHTIPNRDIVTHQIKPSAFDGIFRRFYPVGKSPHRILLLIR